MTRESCNWRFASTTAHPYTSTTTGGSRTHSPSPPSSISTFSSVLALKHTLIFLIIYYVFSGSVNGLGVRLDFLRVGRVRVQRDGGGGRKMQIPGQNRTPGTSARREGRSDELLQSVD